MPRNSAYVKFPEAKLFLTFGPKERLLSLLFSRLLSIKCVRLHSVKTSRCHSASHGRKLGRCRPYFNRRSVCVAPLSCFSAAGKSRRLAGCAAFTDCRACGDSAGLTRMSELLTRFIEMEAGLFGTTRKRSGIQMKGKLVTFSLEPESEILY